MKKQTSLCLMLSVFTLAACGTANGGNGSPGASPGQPALTAELARTGAADEVRLRLRNEAQRRYGYNLCNSRVQRLANGSWTDFQGAAEVCTMELRTLEPGGEATFVFRLQPGAPGGQYRVQTSVEDQSSNQSSLITSNTFALTPR